MGMTENRRPSTPKAWTRDWSPAQDRANNGDQAVLNRDNDTRRRQRGRVERSSWHDEGVVSDYHTD
jgi:hypothetical protein